MSAQPEVVLSYVDDRWRARGDGVDLEHRELRDLDALIERAFAARRGTTCVHVRFDTSTLPVWLRQYQAHYFNYILNVARRAQRA